MNLIKQRDSSKTETNDCELFIVIQPGLEKELRNEILTSFREIFLQVERKDILKMIRIQTGGVSIICPEPWIEPILLYLKTPTKILLRIEKFKARDFPKLYNKIKNIAWTKFLRYPEIEILATSSNSKLIHTGRIRDTIEKGFQDYYKSYPPSEKQKKNFPQNFKYPLHVNLFNDECTLSIDISKRINSFSFYQRGLRKINTSATLRENIAYTLFQKSLSLLGDFCKIFHLIDPLAGSGTLLLEATQNHSSQNQTIESFAFNQLKNRYNKLKKLIIPRIVVPTMTSAIEYNNEHYHALEQNLLQIGSLTKVHIFHNKFQDVDLNLEVESINSTIINIPRIVISNLPYDKRVKVDIAQLARDLEKWNLKNNIYSANFLIAKEHKKYFPKYNVQLDFKNGGIQVLLITRIFA